MHEGVRIPKGLKRDEAALRPCFSKIEVGKVLQH